MLKITVEETESSSNFKVEGKLAGPWVAELERSWRGAGPARRITVDITEVTYVDPEGRRLLTRMHGEGARLIARGCMNRSIVERIEESGG
jgi:hypothetical protein